MLFPRKRLLKNLWVNGRREAKHSELKQRFMIDPSKLDHNGGFLCLSSHWRPNPDAPNPDMPGQKLSMTSYIPIRADDICLCGSGRLYSACCRQERYWHPVCLNHDGKSYSLLAPQSATFHRIDGCKFRLSSPVFPG